MLPELVGFCRQTVQIAARSGLDGYGVPTFSAATSHRARVVGKRKLVRDFEGREVLSSYTVYLAGNPRVEAHDRLTLSTDDVHSTETGALSPVILSVGKFPDDLGRQSTVLFLA